MPKLNVRFIAITDDYDSSRKKDRENISVPIKNMVNAMYAKDMSKKILAAKEAQKRNGNITLSKVAFGYEEDVLSSNDELNKYLHSQAKKLGIELKEGRAHSSDVFYHPNPNFSWQSVRDEHGCGAVEMESFALFATAKYLNKRATCLLTISDSFITHEVTTAEERQNSFTNMMKIALSLADF